MFRSQCRFVKLVPRLGYFPSPKGLYFYSDCALFSFSYVTYTYDESCSHRKARFGIVTAVCLSVFLARLLLMCMDVESNPGPGLRDTRPGKPTEQQAGGFGGHSPFHFGRSDGTLQNPNTGTTTDQYPPPPNPNIGTCSGRVTGQYLHPHASNTSLNTGRTAGPYDYYQYRNTYNHGYQPVSQLPVPHTRHIYQRDQ